MAEAEGRHAAVRDGHGVRPAIAADAGLGPAPLRAVRELAVALSA